MWNGNHPDHEPYFLFCGYARIERDIVKFEESREFCETFSKCIHNCLKYFELNKDI